MPEKHSDGRSSEFRDDSGQIEDALGVPPAVDFHRPVLTEIIEAMRWIDQPLTAIDLAGIVERKLLSSQLVHYLRFLDRIGAIEVAERPSPTLRSGIGNRFPLRMGQRP